MVAFVVGSPFIGGQRLLGHCECRFAIAPGQGLCQSRLRKVEGVKVVGSCGKTNCLVQQLLTKADTVAVESLQSTFVAGTCTAEVITRLIG